MVTFWTVDFCTTYAVNLGKNRRGGNRPAPPFNQGVPLVPTGGRTPSHGEEATRFRAGVPWEGSGVPRASMGPW